MIKFHIILTLSLFNEEKCYLGKKIGKILHIWVYLILNEWNLFLIGTLTCKAMGKGQQGMLLNLYQYCVGMVWIRSKVLGASP